MHFQWKLNFNVYVYHVHEVKLTPAEWLDHKESAKKLNPVDEN